MSSTEFVHRVRPPSSSTEFVHRVRPPSSSTEFVHRVLAGPGFEVGIADFAERPFVEFH
ncbi:hypothetical protein [Kitasatospora sp. NBC_01539]|uniref:hypothetical protein n=1 Tax=Kitasatospora sp. NBC_01539 TaxID=2903577 RepID=UPI0038600B5B